VLAWVREELTQGPGSYVGSQKAKLVEAELDGRYILSIWCTKSSVRHVAHDLLETLGKEGLTSEKPGSREVDYGRGGEITRQKYTRGTMPMEHPWTGRSWNETPRSTQVRSRTTKRSRTRDTWSDC